jgi:hypothetical protein
MEFWSIMVNRKATFHSAMQILIQFLKPSDTMYGQNLHGIKKKLSLKEQER